MSHVPLEVEPHDLEAERAVIGACLVSRKATTLLLTELNASDFYSETHRIIWQAFRALARQDTSVEQMDAKVLERYLGEEEWQRIGAKQYVLRLLESCPHSSNALRYAKIVREASQARETLGVLERARQTCYSPGYADAPKAALTALDALLRADGGRDGVVPLKEAVSALTARLCVARSAQGVTGIRSGIGKLDKGLKGLNRGRYYVIAGRPGMGKSTLIAQMALNAARQQNRVLVASTEMTQEDYLERLACASAGVVWEDVQKGHFSIADQCRIVETAEEIAALDLFIDDRPRQQVVDVRRNAMRYEPDIIFVDYIQRMKPTDRSASRNDQVTQISFDLDSLKKDFDIPIVVAAQLSRAVEQRQDKHPMLSDLRDSGSIEQDADAVLMLYRPSYYNDGADEGLIEIHCEKNRHGSTFEATQYFRDGAFWVGGLEERYCA